MNFRTLLPGSQTPVTSAGGRKPSNSASIISRWSPAGLLSRMRAAAGNRRNFLGFPKMMPSGGVVNLDQQKTRQVPDDPRDAWQLWFPRNLSVQQVVNILRAGRMGDQWQVASLLEVMLDSWPVLKKSQHELRSAVSLTKFSVHAFAQPGKKPTKRAQEKADIVQLALSNFRPNPAVTDERDFQGMVYDLANAYLLGLSMVELQWHNRDGVTLPRTATFIHPAHTVLNDSACIEINNARGGETIPFDPNYFMTAIFQSQSGSCYAMGMIRSIGWWWAAMLATQQWMFGSAQKYGSPYTFLTYARDLMGNKAELDKIEEALDNSGANRYLMAPEGTTADLKPPGTMGSENPQRYLKEQADKECMMLLLGQTSSSQSEAGRLGNNDQHMEVRAERKEAVSKWIGSILSSQFAPAILRRNYGDDSECPIIEPDFTEVETRLQAAQRVSVEVNTGLPMVAEEVYNDLNRRVPQKGDLVVQRGQLGVMSDPEGTPIQPTLEEQVDQQAMIAEASGQFEEPVQAKAQPVTPKAPIRASAYIGDMKLNSLPEDVQKEVLRFAPGAKDTTKVVRYGMTVPELVFKVDPLNWNTAVSHVSSIHPDDDVARKEFEGRRDGKYILIVNDRIVDGHHFLAKAFALNITSSLNVLDLTPARVQLKASAPKKTWISLKP